MQISEIRIKLMEGSEDRLRAFCSITIEESFVIRDLKIIDGTSGSFVAMPSRKLTGHCPRCNGKNHLRAHYCNQCGNKLSSDGRASLDNPQKLYADIAHPITTQCREELQTAIINEFEAELARSEQPGYRSRYDDEFPDHDDDSSDAAEASKSETSVKGSASDRPGASSSSSAPTVGPPRPHFLDRDRSTGVSATGPGRSDDLASDDDFGAGIFDDADGD